MDRRHLRSSATNCVNNYSASVCFDTRETSHIDGTDFEVVHFSIFPVVDFQR